MRTGRILGFIVGGVAALIALVMISVWLLVNPNHYKAKIAAAVKDGTGRDLVLQGDIKLSVFPWIALELGPASLGNPPGFSGEPFASFQHAALRVRLLPLIHERLEIGRVEIDGLDVRLQKNAEGKGNWEGFGRAEGVAGAGPVAGTGTLAGTGTSAGAGSLVASGTSAGADTAAGTGTSVGSGTTSADVSTEGGNKLLQGLAGIKITNAHVRYEKFTLENFKLETAPFTDGVVPISIHFDANRGVVTEHATVEAKVALSNPHDRYFRFAALSLVGQVSLAGDNRPLRWNMSTPGLDLDLAAQTLMAPEFTLAVAGAQMNGRLQATKILDDPSVAGSVTLAPVLLREFVPRWGLSSPQTRDPRAFAQVSGSTSFVYGGNALRFNDVHLTLDDTRIQGNVAIENLETEALTFNLSADHIDADRYFPPEGGPPEGAVSGQARGQPESAMKSAEPSRPLEANGTLSVGSLHMSRLNMSNLRLTLAAKDGLTHVFPVQAQVDGGRYSGDITLDSRGSVPILSLDEHLSGVDMGTLLATNDRSVHLSGKGDITMKASGRGAALNAILRTLNGHVDADVMKGAVEGIDLGYELGRAEALFKHQDAPAAQNTHRTQFDTFKTSTDITNGIAQTKDLTIASQALRVTGQGSTNLASKAINFQLLADTLQTVQGVPIQLPVKVTGTTSDPSIRPDIEMLAKSQLRQKLQNVLHDKLQGLFGKP
jgi:AsmA protein